MRAITEIFSKRVGDVIDSAPVTLDLTSPCTELAAAMAAHGASSAVIVDSAGRPAGIVTEQDILRRAAFKVAPETTVQEIMSSPVVSVAESEWLHQAIGKMRKSGLRHMVATDAEGRLAGILELHDALAMASERLMGQIDRLTQEGSLEGLRNIKKAQVALAEELLADGMSAPEIQTVLTRINNDIYGRIVETSQQAMAADGWGLAPLPFTVIVMGSGGRGENYLFPDQDNGFILQDYPDGDHNRIDAWFVELAIRMTRDLDAVGIPYCKGDCMATNPVWRKSLPQWLEQVRLWGRRRNVTAIRLSDIFFDFGPVWGDRDMASELRAALAALVRENHFFLQEMNREITDHNVALNLLGHIATETDEKSGLELVNLKHAGSLPLVEAVRLLALRDGVLETATLSRIEALHDLGTLDKDERDNLSLAFERIAAILLRKQLTDFREGRTVNYLVDPDSLSKQETTQLTEALEAIDDLRRRVRYEFTGDLF